MSPRPASGGDDERTAEHPIAGAGRLVLVATPIGNLGDLAPRAAAELAAADLIAAEDTRRTRQLLTHLGIPAGNRLRAVHAHNERAGAELLADAVADGAHVVYVSDAGMPGVSDPGEAIVAACVARNLAVSVVPGPSAALGALVVSGLPTTPFRFMGFLPRKGPARRAAIEVLRTAPDTSVLFEAPTRLVATLRELAETLGPQRPAAVVRELTKLHEEVVRAPLGALATGLAARERIRGEVVVVVGGASAEAIEHSDDDVRSAVRAEMAAGASRRDAATAVARRLGMPRRQAYEIALGVDGPTA